MTISPPWPPQFTVVRFSLNPNTGSFVSPLTRAMQVTARPGDRWEMQCEGPQRTRGSLRFDQWRATLSRAASRAEPIYLNDYPNSRPRNYPDGVDGALTCDSTHVTVDTTAHTVDEAYSFGSPYVDGASQTGRTLNVGGAIANATWYAGMYLSFYNGVFRELHILEEDATADSAGKFALSIAPPIRRSPTDVTEIQIDGKSPGIDHRCCGEFLIDPGSSVQWTSEAMRRATDSFRAIEFIR